ncbi:hypothetical protein FRC09_005368 [Ceratobasidium sp. 395]|nr:hypothetical protein FRC09_005368 [Ceratobasidium sp. 395]
MPGATRSLADSIVAAAEPSPALDTHSVHYARDPALVAAVGFFLVGKLSRMVVLVWYAIALPLFRSYFCLQAVYQLLNALIYFPILFIRGRPGAIAALATLGIITDYFPRYLSWIPMRIAHNLVSEKHNPHNNLELSNLGTKLTDRAGTPETDWRNISWYIPATNVEHFVERMAAFVVIVLGEIVLSVVYTASEGQTGLSRVYGTALFALLVAFNFCWLYFDADCTTEFIHAMHRHWFTSVTYTNLHFPLCAALIIVAAATYKMTQHPNKITPVIGWYFSGGLGVALISLALIGITHRGLDPTSVKNPSQTLPN